MRYRIRAGCQTRPVLQRRGPTVVALFVMAAAAAAVLFIGRGNTFCHGVPRLSSISSAPARRGEWEGTAATTRHFFGEKTPGYGKTPSKPYMNELTPGIVISGAILAAFMGSIVVLAVFYPEVASSPMGLLAFVAVSLLSIVANAVTLDQGKNLPEAIDEWLAASKK